MIPVTPIEKLKALAALAEEEVPQPSSAAPPGPAEGRRPGSGNSTSSLGKLNLGRYLDAHGIRYRIKEKDGSTFYCLEQCLFDPNHRNGEASIVTGPKGIFYQCFHNSCEDRTWKEARGLISGDKSMAEWMDGYDPNFKKKKRKKKVAPAATGPAAAGVPALPGPAAPPVGIEGENRYARINNIINHVSVTAVQLADGSLSPAPMEVNHMLFYEKRGDRQEFIPRYAANYLIEHLSPLAYSAGNFWKYAAGLWKTYPRDEIAAVLAIAMKERIQPKMLEGVLKCMEALIYVPEDKWAPDQDLVNVKNGMLNIKTMTLLEHSPDYRSRVQLPVNYNPKAPGGKWYEFLKSIFPEDYEKDENGNYIQESYMGKHFLARQYCGYILLRHCRYQKALFLYGGGSNGKSTFLNIIGAVLGSENTCSLSLTTLGERFKSIYLYNKMANLASETNPKAAMESDIFNSVVAGDEITAEEKYGKAIKFRPFCKFIISMNDPPVVQDRSYAFARRVIVLGFNRRFTKEEINPRMTEELMEELDGVFYWMVEGLRSLLKHDGFVVGPKIQDEIDQLMSRVNPFIVFAEECCELADHLSVRTQELWEAYRDWCKDGGNKPLGRNKFLDQVLSQFPAVRRWREPGNSNDRHRKFTGIGLRVDVIEEIRERVKKQIGTRDYQKDRED